MDDLTKLRGVGKATADKLVAAGISSFAQLAVATDEQLSLARLAGSPRDWSAWREEAKTLAPAPIDVATATPEQINAQAERIEKARMAIRDLAAGVVTAHTVRADLPADAALDIIAAADATLADARQLLDLAVVEARGLIGVPEGDELPAALLEELAPLQELAPIVVDTAEQDALDSSLQVALQQGSEVEVAASAELTAVDPRSMTLDMADGTIITTAGAALLLGQDDAYSMARSIIEEGRASAAAGDLDAALELLRFHREDAVAAQRVMVTILASFDAEIAAMTQLQETAAVDHSVQVTAKVDSRWRIGRQFSKDATVFEPGEIGADELEALKADPMLLVEEL